MNTLEDVVGYEQINHFGMAVPEPLMEHAADVVDAFHAVEIGDYMATALMDIMGASVRVAITAADDNLVEFTCACGDSQGDVPCTHTLSFYLFLADYFEAKSESLYAQPGEVVAAPPSRLNNDAIDHHPTTEAIVDMGPDQLRKFLHTLQILNSEVVGHMETALAITTHEPATITARAHDFVTRAKREYILEEDNVKAFGIFTELAVRLDQLLTLSDGIELFRPYQRFWQALIEFRRDYDELLPEVVIEGITELIKTVHTHVLTALAHSSVDSRELVDWLLLDQQRWSETPMRLRDIGHRLDEDDIQYYFENAIQKPEWVSDVELFMGDPRDVIARSLDQENVEEAVGALMAIRSREDVLAEAHRILEVVSTSRTMGRQVEPIVNLIGFINGLEENESLPQRIEELLSFNAAFPDPMWIEAALDLQGQVEPLLEWYRKYHSRALTDNPASVQVREGIARGTWAIALEQPGLMEWILEEDFLFTPKGRQIMEALAHLSPELFTFVYMQWFAQEQKFLEGERFIDAAMTVVERVAEYNVFEISEVIESIQLFAEDKPGGQQLVWDFQRAVENLLL